MNILQISYEINTQNLHTQAGGAALYLSQYVDARPKDVREALLDSCEARAININALPNTTTKLLNVVNIMQPTFNITPRVFYNVFEGTTQTSMISLRAKPTSSVTITPIVIDSSIGMYNKLIPIVIK